MTTKQIVIEMLERDPKELFSISDILQELKLENDNNNNKRIENIIRNLRVKERLHRHKERDSNNDFQYAVDIHEKNIEVWVLNTVASERNKGVLHGKGKTPKKSRLLNKKEIRSMFAAQYNTLARLEDEAMKIIEEFEVIEKEMLKIRNFIGR